MLSKNIITSNVFILVLVIFLGFVGNIKYKQYKQQKAIEKEKMFLVDQQNEALKKNQDLTRSLSYLTSQSFKERVARQELNMKKEGEIVYNFSEQREVSALPYAASLPMSNAQKWWNYFFTTNDKKN